ncbi:MAG: hypothetical protein LiPW39_562 [Parcubacteria group bacterium LiPW_39]|nr:MAG: hypothetical protein LiPW39_562 [Parcubacteria group bacterium LiPW_39]
MRQGKIVSLSNYPARGATYRTVRGGAKFFSKKDSHESLTELMAILIGCGITNIMWPWR